MGVKRQSSFSQAHPGGGRMAGMDIRGSEEKGATDMGLLRKPWARRRDEVIQGSLDHLCFTLQPLPSAYLENSPPAITSSIFCNHDNMDT